MHHEIIAALTSIKNKFGNIFLSNPSRTDGMLADILYRKYKDERKLFIKVLSEGVPQMFLSAKDLTPHDISLQAERISKKLSIDKNTAIAVINGWYTVVRGKEPPRQLSAMDQLLLYAKNGNVDAQVKLADCYYNGQDVPQDFTQSVEWYRKAAVQGNTYAKDALNRITNTTAPPQTQSNHNVALSKAEQLYLKGAESGNALMQLRLGDCYYKGENIAQDYIKARYWFTKAAEHGLPEALYKLGFSYSDDVTPDQDYKKASYLFKEAANKGYVDAQRHLGLCYELGKVVSKDKILSQYWYNEAAKQGHQYQYGAQRRLNSFLKRNEVKDDSPFDELKEIVELVGIVKKVLF